MADAILVTNERMAALIESVVRRVLNMRGGAGIRVVNRLEGITISLADRSRGGGVGAGDDVTWIRLKSVDEDGVFMVDAQLTVVYDTVNKVLVWSASPVIDERAVEANGNKKMPLTATGFVPARRIGDTEGGSLWLFEYPFPTLDAEAHGWFSIGYHSEDDGVGFIGQHAEEGD